MDREPFSFRVTDLKQYAYCPRILYYHTVLPAIRPTTFKMEAGIEAHLSETRRERRRSLRAYGLKEGRRSFDVPLYSAEMALAGELDMLIECESELIPVDYKSTSQVGDHIRLQIVAYGRLLEISKPETKVRRGFLYLIPTRKAVEVRFTKRLRSRLQTCLREMRAIAKAQHVPAATKRRRRCIDCEFRRFCNDVT